MGEKNRKKTGFGGILEGFSDLVEKLGELSDKQDSFSRDGEIKWKGKGEDLKGVMGFSVKIGLGGKGVKVEPFGNIRKDAKTGEAMVQEIREPVVDVFEEEDHTLVLAEMPGISTEDVRIEIKDDLLSIYAEKKEKKYRKEVLLPRNYPKEKMTISCNNGILEIKCIM